MKPEMAVVDAITLGYLARHALGGHNNDRVTYVNDTAQAVFA